MKTLILTTALTLIAAGQAQAAQLECFSGNRTWQKKVSVQIAEKNVIVAFSQGGFELPPMAKSFSGVLNEQASSPELSVYQLINSFSETATLTVKKTASGFPKNPCPRCAVAPTISYSATLAEGSNVHEFKSCGLYGN